MAANKTLIYLVVALTWFSESFSRSISTGQVSNATHNSTVPTAPTYRQFEGYTPAIITCAVLLQVLLPCFYCCCCKGFKSCCINKLRQAEKRKRSEKGESLIKRDEYGCFCCRIVSLHFYFSFFIWFAYLICYNVLNWSKYGVVFKNLHIMSIVVIVFSFLFVLLESLFSQERDHLDNTMTKDEILAYITRLRGERPIITMSFECSHVEETLGSHGRSNKRRKVVTLSGSQEFKYDSWEDVSSLEMPWISHLTLTRLKIDAVFEFGDTETEEEFERQRKAYHDAFQYVDRDFSFHVKYELPDLTDHRVLGYVDPSQLEGWIRERYFWCASCCCLTWPYRWLFRAKTVKCRYDIKKKLYKSVSPNPDDFPPNSQPNPSFSLSEQLPSDATQTCLNTNDSPSHQDTNLSTNQNGQTTSTNQEGSYCSSNQVPTNSLFGNQDPDSTQTSHRDVHVPLVLEEEPDIPPPSYDMAIE